MDIGQVIQVIGVAIVVSFISPAVLAIITGRQARQVAITSAAIRAKEKAEEWRRQDEVANQAAKAAALLLESNKDVAKAAASTSRKLDVIHTLVNSNMTAAMQSEYDATVRNLVMMKEVIRLNKVAGNEPTDESKAAILFTQDKISELGAKLKDRQTQLDLATKQEQEPLKPATK